MSALEQHLHAYLAVRRALGYKLARAEKLLTQFIAWLDERSEGVITTERALAWATLPLLRWLIRRILLLRPSRRLLEGPRRMAARAPSRSARRAGEPADGLASGAFSSTSGGPLDPAAGRGVGALVRVPFVAAAGWHQTIAPLRWSATEVR